MSLSQSRLAFRTLLRKSPPSRSFSSAIPPLPPCKTGYDHGNPVTIHPLVRDLYKRALFIGRDYPHPDGMTYVRRVWKEAIVNDGVRASDPSTHLNANTTLCDPAADLSGTPLPLKKSTDDNVELKKKIAKGRFMLNEMIGVIKLKKYRTMARVYNRKDMDVVNGEIDRLEALSR